MKRFGRTTTVLAGAALAAASLVFAGGTGVGAATASPASPKACPAMKFGAATPNTKLTKQFTDYGGTAPGLHWSGGDSTYSVRLPDGRTVWLFSDTFLGPSNAGGSRPTESPFIHNSLVVQRGSQLTTKFDSHDPKQPEAYLKPPNSNPATDWYWVGGAAVTGNVLTVLYTEWHLPPGSTDPLGDLQWKKNLYAQYSLRDLRLLGTHDLPSALPKVERGSWILSDGGYTYVYAVQDLGATKNMEIARVRGSDMRGPWEFRTKTGWSKNEKDSAALMSGVANEYSVTKHGGTYVLLTHDTSLVLGNQITAYTSCSPAGPFTNKTVVYKTPEGAPGGTYCGPGGHCTKKVFSYNSHVHPELSSRGRLVISYNVNSLDNTQPPKDNDNYRDASIYRPRFINVPLTFSRAGNR